MANFEGRKEKEPPQNRGTASLSQVNLTIDRSALIKPVFQGLQWQLYIAFPLLFRGLLDS